jgi:hypothetical protein
MRRAYASPELTQHRPNAFGSKAPRDQVAPDAFGLLPLIRMPHTAALPFVLTRSHDVIGGRVITSTKETVHGLVLLDGDRLVFQWRINRETDTVGPQIRTDREVDPVREVIIPLASIAGATVRARWFFGSRRARLVLTAADLQAFEAVAGATGLQLEHPAELVLPLRRANRMAAEEFAGELELAIADRALQVAESRRAVSATPARPESLPAPRQDRLS